MKFWKNNKVLILTALCYWVITGLLPYLILRADFQERADCIAQKYQDLFLFPLILGGILPFFLIPAVKIVFRERKPVNEQIFDLYGNRFKFIIGLAIVSIIVVVTDRNNDYTVWEVKKGVQDSTFLMPSQLLEESELLQLTAQQTLAFNELSKRTLYEHFENPKETFKLLIDFDAAEQKRLSNSIGNFFHKKINSLLDKTANYSRTRYIYMLSLFIQSFAFFAVFITSGLVFILIPKLEGEEKEELLSVLKNCVISLLIIVLWVVKLGANQYQKAIIYNNIEELGAVVFFNTRNVIIGSLLLIITFFLAGAFWVRFRKKIEAIVTLVTSISIPTITFTIPKESQVALISDPELIWYFLGMIILISMVFLPKRSRS